MADTWEEMAQEEFISDLYNDFANELLLQRGDLYIDVIQQFTSERLQSFYVDNPAVAAPALAALKEARDLLNGHPSAALVFAVTAADVGLKATLLKPILHGLVHTDSVAAIIAELVPEQRNDKFRDLLFTILHEFGGVDLQAYKRPGVAQTLWEEMVAAAKKRNAILHKAETSSKEEAEHAIDLASTVLEVLFPAVVGKLGLHIQNVNGRTLVSGKKRKP